MENEKSRDAELAEQFFDHDAKNKRQVIEGFQELLEETDEPSQIHRYARKIRKTEKDIEEMAEKAEEMVENSHNSSVNLQRCIQDSIDTLHSTAQYEGKSVGVNWDAEDYMIEASPTVEKMLYNLFDNSVEHGNDDIEIEATEYEKGLEIRVYDGGEVEDWSEIFPEDAEDRDDYASTGVYLIDRVAENNDIEIEGSEDWSYTVKIPRN
jgi:signal transduction histidine kinase